MVLAILLISIVSSVNASGPTYSPDFQDSEPPSTEAPIDESEESDTEEEETTEEHQGTCERAYNMIENTVKNQEAGYSILRSNPWCHVWIFLKHGKFIQVPE